MPLEVGTGEHRDSRSGARENAARSARRCAATSPARDQPRRRASGRPRRERSLMPRARSGAASRREVEFARVGVTPTNSTSATAASGANAALAPAGAQHDRARDRRPAGASAGALKHAPVERHRCGFAHDDARVRFATRAVRAQRQLRIVDAHGARADHHRVVSARRSRTSRRASLAGDPIRRRAAARRSRRATSPSSA